MLFYLLLIMIIVVIAGIWILLMPKLRVLTKETVYEASIDKVYNTVINNTDWHYRGSIDDLRVIEAKNGFEIWEEVVKGNVTRFKTKEKRPYNFYSFEMENRFFTGYWFAEFESITQDTTKFKATETIKYNNVFVKIMAYIFMDLNKYMQTYQEELREKLKLGN